MDLEFEIEVKASHLHVFCRGEFDVEAVKEMFRAVLAAAEEHNMLSVFVDARGLAGEASDADRYDVGRLISEQMWEHGGLRGIRIGFVVEGERFGRTVAENRGCTVKAGSDLKEIRGWLGIEPADRSDADGNE